MKKLLFIIFAVLTTMVVSSQSLKNLDSQKFCNYLQRIEPITLPFQSGCYDFINFSSTDRNSALIDTTYSSKWEIPYKRIDTKKNFGIVIYLSPADIYVPVLKTFDLNGRIISKLQIFTNCNGEPGFRERQFVSIDKNLQIVKTDSIWRWKLDADYNEIPSTEKIEVIRSIYEIGENGLINIK
jgi:hypothetical protein